MLATIVAVLSGLSPAGQTPPAIETVVASCNVNQERMRAAIHFFDLQANYSIAEFSPNFVITDCLADIVSTAGAFTVLVDGGNRIPQVAERITIQKKMKLDPSRYGNATLVELDPKKAPSGSAVGTLDRILIVDEASDMLRNAKRASGMLRAMAVLAKSAGILGVVGLPDDPSIDDLLTAARSAGWELMDRKNTSSDGLLLLKFRRI